jgi:hypothetical protein
MFFSIVTATLTVVVFVGLIIYIANCAIDAWYRKNVSGLNKTVVAATLIIGGCLVPLWVWTTWGVSLTALSGVAVLGTTLTWILLTMGAQRIIRTTYPKVAFESRSSLVIEYLTDRRKNDLLSG